MKWKQIKEVININKNEKELELPNEHLAVYEVISNSKEKYITKNLILAQLNKDYSYKRKLEQIIYDLVVKYSCPIGSSSAESTKGFFIISDKYDLHIAKRDLTSRTFTINKRVEALENIKL